MTEKPRDWNPEEHGHTVSLNHQLCEKKPQADTANRSTLGKGAQGFWEIKARDKETNQHNGRQSRQDLSTNLIDEFGISWGGGDRSLIDGPKYGNHGGKGHGGNKPPVDSSDRMYKQHDKGWGKCEQLPRNQVNACKEDENKQLAKRLKGLPKDSIEWPYPPPKGLRKDVERFRDGAIIWFK